VGKHTNRYALVNIDTLRIVTVEGKVLLGSCRRCGTCCKKIGDIEPCEFLGCEKVDGKPRHFCKIYWDRPMRCALYPQPQDPKPECCGFYYEEHA